MNIGHNGGQSTAWEGFKDACTLACLDLLAAALGIFLAVGVIRAPDAFPQTSPSASSSTAQIDAERAKLEKDKLMLEIDKLKDELHWFTRLTTVFIPLTMVVVGAVVGYFVNRRLNDLKSAEDLRLRALNSTEANRQAAQEREAARFTALIEDRTRAYALAYARLSPTALFFPPTGVGPAAAPANPSAAGPDQLQPAAPPHVVSVEPAGRDKGSPQITRDDCARIGGQLLSWYFGDGGLLMTKDSRDAYFALMDALRRAAASPRELAVQTVGEHAQVISLTLISEYRTALAKKYAVFAKFEAKSGIMASDLTDWKFGALPDSTSDAERFKDYVLIQVLASRFRTTLTDDIGSRKPPAGRAEESFH